MWPTFAPPHWPGFAPPLTVKAFKTADVSEVDRVAQRSERPKIEIDPGPHTCRKTDQMRCPQDIDKCLIVIHWPLYKKYTGKGTLAANR